MARADIVGYVILRFTYKKIDRRWRAYCEELGTATFGRTLPEAKDRIKEAVLLHLNTLDDVGERDRFFKKHNIELHHTRPRKTAKISVPISEDVYVQPYVQPIRELVHA